MMYRLITLRSTHMSNLGDERVVGIRVGQHGTDRKENFKISLSSDV